MVCLFARIGVALGRMVNHVYTQNRRLWVRLREKGGKRPLDVLRPQFRGIPELHRYQEKKPVSAPGRRCFIGELPDGVRDPAPDSLTLAIAGSCKRISASRTLRPGLVAVTLEQ